MADITIPLGAKATSPEIPAKEYNEAYIMDLAVRAHAIGAADSIYVEYVPYDKATGDRLLTDRREIRVPLWAAVQAVPEAAAAFGAIAAAIPALVAYQEELRLAALEAAN